jgi:16S rRNA (uracil1498-N3)-methyltransferase
VVPDVLPISSVGALMASPEFDARIVCVEPGAGVASSVTAVPRPASALLLVGPEGGWTADELSQARAAGAVCISLGPRTLRADTAPTVALAALWTHWGWT